MHLAEEYIRPKMIRNMLIVVKEPIVLQQIACFLIVCHNILSKSRICNNYSTECVLIAIVALYNGKGIKKKLFRRSSL